MKKWELASQIRYALGLNDRAEDILVKLTETDLMTFHLAAFSESIGTSVTNSQLNALTDDILNVSNNNFLPGELLLISNCTGEIALKDLPIIFQFLIGLPLSISLFSGNGSKSKNSVA